MRLRALSLAAVLLGLAGAAPAENLAALLADTRVLILDAPSGTRQRFSDSQLTQWLNFGQRQAIAQTRCLQQSTLITLAAGTTYYALPNDFLSMRRLVIGSKYLQEMTPASLDGRSRGWEAASGYPTYYFLNFSSPTKVGFAPFPGSTTDAADPVKVDYYQDAADLATGTDVPFNGNPKLAEFHHGLVFFAAALAMSTYGAMDRSNAYLAIYTATVGQMKDRCREIPNYLPSATGTP